MNEHLTRYVTVATAECGYNDDEEATIGGAPNAIFQDLVARAERKMLAKADEYEKSTCSHFGKMYRRIAENIKASVGGKVYEYSRRYTCNCCNDDFETDADPETSPCCQSDWRKTKDASRFIVN